MKKFIILIFLGLFCLESKALQLEEVNIIQFKKSFEGRIRKKIKDDTHLKKALSSSVNIRVVPICYVDPTKISKHSFYLTEALKIDSTSSFSILKRNDLTTIGHIYYYHSLSYNIGVERNKSNLWEEKMIEEVYKRFSQNLFLVSFSDLDSNRVVGFFQNGNIHFLDRRMTHITDFKDLIVQQNGSLEKYFEVLEFKKRKDDLLTRISSLESAKEILRNDYISYGEAFPEDTLKVLKMLIDEITLATRASEAQRALIQNQILRAKASNTLMTFNDYGVPFYGLEIAPCIKSVLTKGEYFLFLENRELNSWLATKASNRIYKYFSIDKKVPQDQISREFNTYVFGKIN